VLAKNGCEKRFNADFKNDIAPLKQLKALWGEREPESSGTYCGKGVYIALTVTSLQRGSPGI
jgi:hypothetical protein